jgi:hypothetical protein
MFHPMKAWVTGLFTRTELNRKMASSSRPNNTRLKLETLEQKITPSSTFPLAGAGVNLGDLSQGSAITTDSAGNVYVTGTWQGTQDFGGTSLTAHGADDAFVAKYSSAGTLDWVADFGGGGATISATGIAVDSQGNVYSTGYFEGNDYFNGSSGTDPLTSSNSGSDINVYVSKLNSSGQFVYVEQLGAGGQAQATGIAVTGSGVAVVTGNFTGSGNFNPGSGTNTLTTSNGGTDTNAFVAELNSSGGYNFADLLGSGSTAQATGIALDNSGNVYTTGWFTGTGNFNPGAGTNTLTSTGGINSYLSKLNSSGNFVFAEDLGANAISSEGSAIAVDGSGNIITTGFFQGTGDFSGTGAGTDNLSSSNGGSDANTYVAKYSSSGQYIFAVDLGSGSSNAVSTSIAIDHLGDIYVAGSFIGTANFNTGSGTDDLTSSTSGADTNGFVAVLNASGQYLNAVIEGYGSPIAVADGIAVDRAGNIDAIGTFAGTGSFNSGTSSVGLSSSDGGADSSFFINQVPQSANVLVADIKGQGLYEYNPFSGWTKIYAADPTSFQMDAANDVFAVFSTGFYEYTASTATWAKLTPSIPTACQVSSGGQVVADFHGSGLYEYVPGTGWIRLSPTDTTSFAIDAIGDVAAYFQGQGLYEHTSSGWTKLSVTQPVSFAVDAGGDVVASFSGSGLYVYFSGSWIKLTPSVPTSFAVNASGDVAATFSGSGLYEVAPGGSWTKLSSTIPTSFVLTPSGSVIDYISGSGLYATTTSTNVKLTANAPAAYVVDSQGNIYADFHGKGIWEYVAASGAWVQLSPTDSTMFAT